MIKSASFVFNSHQTLANLTQNNDTMMQMQFLRRVVESM